MRQDESICSESDRRCKSMEVDGGCGRSYLVRSLYDTGLGAPWKSCWPGPELGSLTVGIGFETSPG